MILLLAPKWKQI